MSIPLSINQCLFDIQTYLSIVDKGGGVDDSGEPIKHPLIEEIFTGKKGTGYFRPSN